MSFGRKGDTEDTPEAAPADGPDPCPYFPIIRETFERVGDKWSLSIVCALKPGPMRFNALKRRIEGISQRILTLTLRGLERDGLVSRTVAPTVPPRVDYELTSLGRSLIESAHALAVWGVVNRASMLKARANFDEAAQCTTRRVRSGFVASPRDNQCAVSL